MGDYPTRAQIKAWNNDGMDPDWRPSRDDKNFWDAPEYFVPIISKVEFSSKVLDSNQYPYPQRKKVYKKMRNEIHSILDQVDPLKAYLEGVADLIRKYDIYQGRVNIVGFKYKSMTVECYICLDQDPQTKDER
jgi:hypothetical protein